MLIMKQVTCCDGISLLESSLISRMKRNVKKLNKFNINAGSIVQVSRYALCVRYSRLNKGRHI
jgi:hypothetical protein